MDLAREISAIENFPSGGISLALALPGITLAGFSWVIARGAISGRIERGRLAH